MPAPGVRPAPAPTPIVDPDDQLARYQRPAFVPGPFDAPLGNIITRAQRGDTGVAAHYDDVERRVAALIWDLPADACRALARRFDDPHPDDHLMAAFARLTGERRARLRAWLAEAPRRELLRCA